MRKERGQGADESEYKRGDMKGDGRGENMLSVVR